MIGLREIFGVFTGTKRLLLVGAGALALGGMVWNGGSLSSKKPIGKLPDSMGDALRADWSDGKPRRESWFGNRQALGDGAIRIGLSFIAAMAFGALLRVAVKTAISLLVIGGFVIWILQSRGMIDPGWQDYYGSVSESRNWLMARASVVGQILQAHLPSASAALIGFGFGLRR
jgi:uncharacterized membrane protein (Fun14 family)